MAFGVRPWEVERLRPVEFDAMRATLDAQDVDGPVSMSEAIEEAPVFDEGALPDPFRSPPQELGRLS